MATARYLGVDLAWREDRADLPANETGVAAIDARGQILDAGWRRGVDEAVAWTAALWAHHGLDRCQVLGPAGTLDGRPAATIIVPARPEQRR
jgi:hypothetical protein